MRLHLDLACAKLNATEVRLSNTQVQLTNTQADLTNTQVQLTNTREEFEATTRKLEEKYNVVEKMMQCSEEHNYFKWKISGFAEVLRKAKSGEKTRIYSEPFYRYGYKCRLRCDPNGYSPAQNTHLSLYFVVMKGEHDDILPWPFHKKVTVTLIDQQENVTDRKAIVKLLLADPNDFENNTSFVKPVTESNPGYGYGNFVSHDKLEKNRYIADDTIIFQVQVSPPQ